MAETAYDDSRRQPRTAVITGGSSGIGAALARLLATRGWQLVLVARGEERLQAVADELGAEAEVCDVGDREAVEALGARVRARHPELKLLVNNAGIPARADFLAGDPARIESVMRVNYLGGLWCLRAFLPALEAAAPSDVVNVISVAGTVAFPPSGPYSASKHAQLAFSRASGAQLRGRGIRAHAILPGFVETEGFPQRGVLPKALEWTVVEPERIARAIVRAVERDRREGFVPWWYRSVAVLQALTPSLVSRLLARGRYLVGPPA